MVSVDSADGGLAAKAKVLNSTAEFSLLLLV